MHKDINKRREASRNWQKKNNEWFRQYYQRNKEKYRERGFEYRKKVEVRERNKLSNLKYKEKYKLIIRKRRIKKNYNTTFEIVNNILLEQKNKCAICKNIFLNSKNIHIDHCHKMNKFRGLLCFKCNIGLGNFGDSIEKLKSAIKYLKIKG